MKRKLINWLLAVVFAVCYCLGYIYFLNAHFEYANFPLASFTMPQMVLSVLIASLPVFFYNGYRHISSFISVFIFMLLYVPTIMTFPLAYNGSFLEVLMIQLIFCVSMILFFVADRFALKLMKLKGVSFLSFKWVLYITILFSAYTIIIYKDSLQLVTFEEVYELRYANIEVGADVVTRFITSWLGSVLMPVCVLYGIIDRKPLYFLAGSVAAVVLYMAMGAKVSLLLPVFLLVLYHLLRRFGVQHIYATLSITLSVLIIAVLLFATNVDSVVFIIGSLFMWRTVAVGGQLNVLYYDFFLKHPKTYFSHVGPVNTITDSYPYKEPIGYIIGDYYYPGIENMQANANFWTTDGIAALGIGGVILISVVFFLLLIVINSISKKYNSFFLILLFATFLSTLLNVSLFQSMWSGGGFFIILMLLFLRTGKKSILKEGYETPGPQIISGI